jgi:agmatinase
MTSLQAPAVPFLGAPVVLDPAAVKTPYAFYGIPFGPPYAPVDLTVCAGAADAIRELARDMEYGPPYASHFDFDWGGPLFPDDAPTVTDCGDVIGDRADPDAIWDRAIEVGRTLVAAGRVPLVMGGLDAIPPMVVAAFDGIETVNVLHVDAHVDFREEVGGVRRGYSSPIRRIRELGCTGRIVQVGLRAVGSGRPSDVEDARRAGNHLVTAWEIHEHGIGSVLQVVDATPGRWVVTIDCDGMDPTIAPAVGWPEPGGLTYPQIAGIVRALARAGRVAALIATEFQPALDAQRMTARTVTRLFLNVIGLQRDPAPAAGRAG